MYPFSCVLWAIFLALSAPVLRQIARYLPHHRSENASKTHPKSSHDKFKTASKFSNLNLNEYLCPIFQFYTELNMQEKIIILDFGSQTTQLIGRRVRELNMYCEIVPYNKFPFGDPFGHRCNPVGKPFLGIR